MTNKEPEVARNATKDNPSLAANVASASTTADSANGQAESTRDAHTEPATTKAITNATKPTDANNNGPPSQGTTSGDTRKGVVLVAADGSDKNNNNNTEANAQAKQKSSSNSTATKPVETPLILVGNTTRNDIPAPPMLTSETLAPNKPSNGSHWDSKVSDGDSGGESHLVFFSFFLLIIGIIALLYKKRKRFARIRRRTTDVQYLTLVDYPQMEHGF